MEVYYNTAQGFMGEAFTESAGCVDFEEKQNTLPLPTTRPEDMATICTARQKGVYSVEKMVKSTHHTLSRI